MFTQSTKAHAPNSMSITLVSAQIDTLGFGLEKAISVAQSLKTKWMVFRK
jgi:hypothetical protein